jgi:hypothetical protein
LRAREILTQNDSVLPSAQQAGEVLGAAAGSVNAVALTQLIRRVNNAELEADHGSAEALEMLLRSYHYQPTSSATSFGGPTWSLVSLMGSGLDWTHGAIWG